MSIYTALARYAARRRSIRAAMLIADLPAAIQKDIGWPNGIDFDCDMRFRNSKATETPQS